MMKFSYKILLCSIIMTAAAFGIGGYFFVNNVFQVSMERETGQALDENSILQFAFGTAALNIPLKYNVLQNSAVEEIGADLENSGQGTGRLLRLSGEDKGTLYASEGFVEDTGLLSRIEPGLRAWQVICADGHYYIQTGSALNALDRCLYLETMRDVTDVYRERARGFAVYRNLTLLLLVLSSVFMYFISFWLTRPIRILTQAAKKMTAGDYGYRARQVSHDEMGQLTMDFNHMACVLEENIRMLKDEVRAREDFIAAFSHELKTPLTAVIGYADMLRSCRLDDEKHFMCANYIYTEGKRLEAMSLRLLAIMVTRRSELELQEVDVEALFSYLKNIYEGTEDIYITFRCSKCRVQAEADLLKTVLINLVDNACKASGQGDSVEVYAQRGEGGCLFSVKDHGLGISPDECRKITEAFYMVDKSRSRSHNGAGLGLTLCVEILNLHKSSLEIKSVPGEGSCFSFLLPFAQEVKRNGTQ